MGVICEATCECGYASDPLPLGSGMLGPEEERALARCDACREIVAVPRAPAASACPRCGAQVETVAHDWPDLAAGAPPGHGGLVCPRCGERALALREVGLWD